ncbi:MAG: ABC transporter substrate-binding protein [Limnochordia bacterium]
MAFDFYPPVSLGQYVLKDVDPGGYWFLWEKREDWERTAVGQLYGEPKALGTSSSTSTAHRSVRSLPNPATSWICATLPWSLSRHLGKDPGFRTYRQEYPWIVNIDPCITGITFNVLVEPFDNKDVRWALALAMDIVDVMALSFDGAGVMGALLVPPTPVYLDWYYEPMEEWLREFTLDIEVDGAPFKPYDPGAAKRLADYAAGRGYDVPDDPAKQREIFGYGWWKYAPEAAAQLLERNGFSRDTSGRWLLPDGTPWKITITAHPNPAHPGLQEQLCRRSAVAPVRD